MRQSYPDLSSLILNSGRQNRIEGVSGYKHQIDVSLQDSHRLFIIECKQWNKKAGVAEVLVLASRSIDIQQNFPSLKVFPILVSTKEATKPAKQIAGHFKIAIEAVKSAAEFGLRLGNFIWEGVFDGTNFSEQVECIVCRNGVIVPS